MPCLWAPTLPQPGDDSASAPAGLPRENLLVLDIFFEALNYETIEQKKAYEVAGLLGEWCDGAGEPRGGGQPRCSSALFVLPSCSGEKGANQGPASVWQLG